MALAIEGATLDGEAAGLRIEGGTIAALGPDVDRRRPATSASTATGMAIVPGFVNGHTHAAMTLFRGYADDLPLMEWLQEHIWPAEARLDADDVYWGTRLACVGDDPHRDRPVLGHVLAARARPPARSPTPGFGRRSARR